MSLVRNALFAKLAATSAVTSKLAPAATDYDKAIYHEQAPAGAQFPYVIFSKAAGTKTRAMGAPEAFKREAWMVKAVDRGTTSKLAEEIAQAIDAALDGGSVSISGKTTADLCHAGDIDYSESRGDQQYRHAGANYRLTLTSA